MYGTPMQDRKPDDWKDRHVPIDRNGDDALVMHKLADGGREFIVAHGYDEETGHWSYGTYYDSLASAAADLEGRAISNGTDVILADFWYRTDIEEVLKNRGIPATAENVDLTVRELRLDGDPYDSWFMESLAESGDEMVSQAAAIAVTIRNGRIRDKMERENGAFYNPATGDLILSYLAYSEDPEIIVHAATPQDLRGLVSGLSDADIEYGDTVHELAGGLPCRGRYDTFDEFASGGLLDAGELLDVSDVRGLVAAVEDLAPSADHGQRREAPRGKMRH